MGVVFNSTTNWSASITMHGSKPNHFCMRFSNPPAKYKRTFVYPMTVEGFAKVMELLKEYDSLCETPTHGAKLPKDFVQNMVKKGS